MGPMGWDPHGMGWDKMGLGIKAKRYTYKVIKRVFLAKFLIYKATADNRWTLFIDRQTLLAFLTTYPNP